MVYAAAADGRTDGRTPEDAYTISLPGITQTFPCNIQRYFTGVKMTIFS